MLLANDINLKLEQANPYQEVDKHIESKKRIIKVTPTNEPSIIKEEDTQRSKNEDELLLEHRFKKTLST